MESGVKTKISCIHYACHFFDFAGALSRLCRTTCSAGTDVSLRRLTVCLSPERRRQASVSPCRPNLTASVLAQAGGANGLALPGSDTTCRILNHASSVDVTLSDHDGMSLNLPRSPTALRAARHLFEPRRPRIRSGHSARRTNQENGASRAMPVLETVSEPNVVLLV